jgi:hypothetical protein
MDSNQQSTYNAISGNVEDIDRNLNEFFANHKNGTINRHDPTSPSTGTNKNLFYFFFIKDLLFLL